MYGYPMSHSNARKPFLVGNKQKHTELGTLTLGGKNEVFLIPAQGINQTHDGRERAPAPCRVKLGKPVESAVHPYRKAMSNVSSAFPNLSLPAAKNGLACAVHASPKNNSPIFCQKSHLTISLFLNPPGLL
ncbi:hypothetical protein CGCF415_v013861 [Colletotrichum fructicola]|nr:hypothetical protein CGCFRS4_v015529 [Colletotrichum fructicola]KAF4890017.1 hypothetical protein CGCF415_v013861 [Colletotrichum fructicola]KAF4926220.1 hypothetical protein CGCF245_v013710 [Colletotrichum fructicola]